MSTYSGLVLPLLASALLQVLHVQIENSPLPLIYTKLLITNPASQLPLKLNSYHFFTRRPTAGHTSWRKNAGSTCSAGSTPGNQEGCVTDDDLTLQYETLENDIHIVRITRKILTALYFQAAAPGSTLSARPQLTQSPQVEIIWSISN